VASDTDFISGYSNINGLRMYYEIYGSGDPLFLIHGGGSTIQTSFGNIIPGLAARRKLIGVELQAHGRTNDRDSELSFEQDADDVVALMASLGIKRADFLGFSNGGCTVAEIALRHPERVNKIILASAVFNRNAASSQFWKGFEKVTLEMMPQVLKDAYLRVNNDPEGLLNMFRKDVKRMMDFRGWTDAQIASIEVPALLINGNHDVGSPEHAVHVFRTLPNCELAIFPGGHGTYLGTAESVIDRKLPAFNALELITAFLEK
jgi:pimeloyl-ACP methyl ester carboxylesterase